MDENNIFNSFSFKKWADYVRKEKIENEILRQRMEQVTRLRTKLIRERNLRDQADILTDEDIDKVIGFLNAGYSLNADNGVSGLTSNINNSSIPIANSNFAYTSKNIISKNDNMKLSNKVSNYLPKDDDYIFNEIKQFYTNTNSLNGLHGTIPVRFKFNHRCTSNGDLKPIPQATNPKSRFFMFQHNKKYASAEEN